MLSDVELAWAAGLFEGEGSIRIARPTERNRGGVLTVSVSNTDANIIAFFQERWPGSVKLVAGSASRSPSQVWTIAARRAAAYIEAVLPYLRTAKYRTKAALGVEFQQQKMNGRRVSADYLERQWDYYEQMRVLNQRGRRVGGAIPFDRAVLRRSPRPRPRRLTPEQVREIRRRRERESGAALALAFGVSESAISAIGRGEIYRDVR